MTESSETNAWIDVLSEAQFAADQTVIGIDRLAQVRLPGDLFLEGAEDATRHELHSALLSFTTGIERLCKLSLTCAHFDQHGTHVNVSQYRHRMARLLQAVEDIPTVQTRHRHGGADGVIKDGRPPTPVALIDLLERYAQGQARYEYLDGLSRSATTLVPSGLYTDWAGIANGLPAHTSAEWVNGLLSSTQNALIWVTTQAAEVAEIDDLEPLVSPFIDQQLDRRYSPHSLALAMECFAVARWVAAHLVAVTTWDPARSHANVQRGLPILSDVLAHRFLHSDRAFIEHELLRMNDANLLAEVLDEIPEADLDD